MRRWRLGWIALAVCAIGFAGCSATEPPGKNTESAEMTPQPAPDIDLPLQASGPPSKLSSLHGKVVILDFWATWCGPCKLSMPALEKIYLKYRDKGLVVIGVSEDEPSSEGQIPAVMKELGATYPTILASGIPDIASKYPHDSIPVLYVIDKAGNIVKRQMGLTQAEADAVDLADVDSKVAQLLKQ